MFIYFLICYIVVIEFYIANHKKWVNAKMICMKLFEFSGYYNQIKQCVKFIKYCEDIREYAGGIF
jgi:hypothetical protein